jgi:hypothetical protein
MGVTVAIIDSGINYSNASLEGSIAPGGISLEPFGQPVYDGGADPGGNGHGTYMSLVITDSTGVAPDAKILPVRISPLAMSDAVHGIKYLIARRKSDPTIRVSNISMGTPDHYLFSCDDEDKLTQDLAEAIADALAAGIITFAATGNEANCGGICAPACVSAAVRVAADYDGYYPTTYFDPPGCGDLSPDPYWVVCMSNIAFECNWLLAAPGYDISVGGFSGHGTSQATAHCSGVAALMFSKDGCGSLTAREARQIICDTASTHNFNLWCDIPQDQKHVDAFAAVNAVSGPVCAALGDMDCDGLVSGYDFPGFEECMGGPGAPYPHTSCACTDFPTSPPDGDVDLRDLYMFQLAFEGMGSGACCHADSTCSITTIYDCLAEQGAVYNGHDSTCADTNCVMTRYANMIDPIAGYIPAGPGLQLADDITLAGTGGGLLTHYELLVYGGGGGTFTVTAQLYTGCPGDGGTPIADTQRTFTNNPDGQAVLLSADFDSPVYIPQAV